ncbi:hypothetical protein HK405_003183 [Cladochytrium tenue]|nr:hypothetical protein HK405_003183 [Cladochytrium tenue]
MSYNTAPAPGALPPPPPPPHMPRRWSCETCRAKKVKCDGVRPVCGNCARRMSRRCVFLGLKARVDPALARKNQEDIALALQRRADADNCVTGSTASSAGANVVTATSTHRPTAAIADDDEDEEIPNLAKLNIFDFVASGVLDPDPVPGLGGRVDTVGSAAAAGTEDNGDSSLRRPGAPVDEERRLAEAYFDGVSMPLLFVHRRSYFSDMRRLPALLRAAICAVGSLTPNGSVVPPKIGQWYFRKARALAIGAFDHPCIANVQGLLVLSHSCAAFGCHELMWLYDGMAGRMEIGARWLPGECADARSYENTRARATARAERAQMHRLMSRLPEAYRFRLRSTWFREREMAGEDWQAPVMLHFNYHGLACAMSHPDVLDYLDTVRNVVKGSEHSVAVAGADSGSCAPHFLNDSKGRPMEEDADRSGGGATLRRRLHKESTRCLSSALRMAIGAGIMLRSGAPVTKIAAPVSLLMLHAALSLFLLRLAAPFVLALHTAAVSTGAYRGGSQLGRGRTVDPPPIASLTAVQTAARLSDIAGFLDIMALSCPAAGYYAVFVRRLVDFVTRRDLATAPAAENFAVNPSANHLETADGSPEVKVDLAAASDCPEPGRAPSTAPQLFSDPPPLSASPGASTRPCSPSLHPAALSPSSAASSGATAPTTAGTTSAFSDAKLLAAVRQFCAAPFVDSVRTLQFLDKFAGRSRVEPLGTPLQSSGDVAGDADDEEEEEED